MLYVLGKGLLFGMGMSLMLGTVFFSLIQNSIQNGWRKGALIAVGVVVSDFIFISLALFGVNWIEPGQNNMWIQGAAVVLLLGLGLSMFREKQPKVVSPQTRLGKALYYTLNGFLLNILNPVNFVFWAGLATVARTTWGYDTDRLMVFFSGCLIAIFGTEVLISFLAHRIKNFLNASMLKWINWITGMAFIGIAIYMVLDMAGVISFSEATFPATA
jgi:threonine/homoserine/homoserine lactone efflux protein